MESIVVVNNIGYWTAFIAGFLSFFTPCILPIIPGFVAYFLASKNKNIKHSLINSLSFILGLSTVFINMGFLSGYIGGFLVDNKIYLNIAGGSIIILFGLYTMKVIDIPFLGKMSISSTLTSKKNFLSSFVLGLIFSLVWSPCLSPTLGTILILSSQSGQVVKGGVLLTIYSIGFGIPFVLSALLLERFAGVFDKVQKLQKKMELITGITLIVVGIFMITGLLDKVFS